MKIITPSDAIPKEFSNSIFLAGSMDTEWRKELIKTLKKTKQYENVVVYDPTVKDWKSIGEEKITNELYIKQCNWEHDAMDKAGVIVVNFTKDSDSSISMLDMGLYTLKNKIIVCCPDEFRKSGYIHFICKRYGLKLVKSFDIVLENLKKYKK